MHVVMDQQNYQTMLKYKKLPVSAVHQMRLVAVKISSFTPHLQERCSSPIRYSQDQILQQHRNMVQTSFSHRRPLISSELPSSRAARTSQTSRLSQYVQREVNRLHQDSGKVEQYTPMIRDKIKKLRSLMLEKEAVLRNPNTKLPQRCYFSEYKMGRNDQGEQQSLTLHSRKKADSPYMRALKSKRIFVSRDSQENPMESDSNDRKMVLVGGGISARQSNSDEQSLLQSPSKLTQRMTSKSSHRYYLRSSRTPMRSKDETAQQDDCKPWQVHKLQHLQEYGHVNFL